MRRVSIDQVHSRGLQRMLPAAPPLSPSLLAPPSAFAAVSASQIVSLTSPVNMGAAAARSVIVQWCRENVCFRATFLHAPSSRNSCLVVVAIVPTRSRCSARRARHHGGLGMTASGRCHLYTRSRRFSRQQTDIGVRASTSRHDRYVSAVAVTTVACYTTKDHVALTGPSISIASSCCSAPHLQSLYLPIYCKGSIVTLVPISGLGRCTTAIAIRAIASATSRQTTTLIRAANSSSSSSSSAPLIATPVPRTRIHPLPRLLCIDKVWYRGHSWAQGRTWVGVSERTMAASQRAPSWVCVLS